MSSNLVPPPPRPHACDPPVLEYVYTLPAELTAGDQPATYTSHEPPVAGTRWRCPDCGRCWISDDANRGVRGNLYTAGRAWFRASRLAHRLAERRRGRDAPSTDSERPGWCAMSASPLPYSVIKPLHAYSGRGGWAAVSADLDYVTVDLVPGRNEQGVSLRLLPAEARALADLLRVATYAPSPTPDGAT